MSQTNPAIRSTYLTSNRSLESAQLWQSYLAAPSERGHEALWRGYQPLVQHIAERFNDKMGGGFDASELLSAGNVGLLDALAEFNASTSAHFESIAVPMIRRAIARSLALDRSKNERHCLRLELTDAIDETVSRRAVGLPRKAESLLRFAHLLGQLQSGVK